MDELTPACTQIHEWIESELGRKGQSTEINRASSAPSCVKKLWYTKNGFPGEPLRARSILTFTTGDLVEHALKFFIEKSCVGPDKLYSEVDFGKKIGTFTVQHREFTTYEQETVTIDLKNGIKLTGHGDGWGKRNSDGRWEYIEIKSSANYGFDRFVSGETPDYIYQAHAIMMSDKALALGADSTRFFYQKKETAHIYDRLYKFHQEIADAVKKKFYFANQEETPEAPYKLEPEMSGRAPNKKPTGRLVAKYPCSYCPFLKSCFPEIKTEFKSGRPVFYVDQKN